MATVAQIKALRDATGCCLMACKAALKYAEDHGGGEDMAVAWIKAMTLGVYTKCSFDERVQRFMAKEVGRHD